jgi:hypothetical protein
MSPVSQYQAAHRQQASAARTPISTVSTMKPAVIVHTEWSTACGGQELLIVGDYPNASHGRQPLGLEKMLRIYFVRQWFNLSDPQAEDALHDREAIR